MCRDFLPFPCSKLISLESLVLLCFQAQEQPYSKMRRLKKEREEEREKLEKKKGKKKEEEEEREEKVKEKGRKRVRWK